MLFAKREWISIALMLLSAGLFHFLMRGYEDNARAFPGMLVSLMLTLAAIKIAVEIYRGLKQKIARSQAGADGRKFPLPRIGFFLLLFMAYIYLLEDIGFYSMAFLFFFLSTLGIQTTRHTVRDTVKRFVICFCFVGFLYLLFTVLLQTQLPRGIFV